MTACIVEVALNGATQKDANPHVPPAEITADALARGCRATSAILGVT